MFEVPRGYRAWQKPPIVSGILARIDMAGIVHANGWRLSCGALKKHSFPDLRAPSASSACQTARSLRRQ